MSAREIVSKFVQKWRENRTVRTGLAGLGLAVVTHSLFSLAHKVWRAVLRPGQNLAERYGQGTWALITGATDGLGLALAVRFAKLGFNIILLGRSAERLTIAEKEVKGVAEECKVVKLQADLSKCLEPGFFDKIIYALEGLEISILVNNAGLLVRSYFERHKEEDIVSMIMINSMAPALLTRKVLPLMVKRTSGKRSLVLNITSNCVMRPQPYYAVYAATKSYLLQFTRSLKTEYDGVSPIDFVAHRPGAFATKMTGRKPDLFNTCSLDACADGIIKQLGHGECVTDGHWRHSLINWRFSIKSEAAVRDHCKRRAEMQMEGKI